MLTLLLATSALAVDTWSNVVPGIDYLHRTQSGPRVIYAVRADISLPNVALRATGPTESPRTTSSFANLVGGMVTINGDWFAGSDPVGLAIGDGWRWSEHADGWSYFGCDLFKNCAVEETQSTAWWSQGRLFNAVGANGARLVDDGVALSFTGTFYETDRHPRSAVCLEADGRHMWFVVIQGRVAWSIGMTWNETAVLMRDLGCWDAVMLDGGGSSTLVVNGQVKNTPTDGSERVVGNHLSLIYASSTEPACVGRQNRRWCEGTVMQTCAGGRYKGPGDCGYYGLACEQDGDWAYCVDPRCPGADGQRSTCLSDTVIGGCTDGVYGEGDCGVFGLACYADAAEAWCDLPCPDSDGDGWSDCEDGCPADRAKSTPGVCGCGVSDVDSDGDGWRDCQESCDADRFKSAPGVCGCGVSDVDSDGDAWADCVDGCDLDAAKVAPGTCGCGLPEEDLTGDGVPDCVVCGDGLVEAPETCDDGGRAGGDGCSTVCAAEALALTGPTPGLAGVVNRFTITGLGAGAEALLLGSTALGRATVPGCPGLVLPLARPLVLGVTSAGLTGAAELAVPVPGRMAGRSAAVLAVDLGSCRASEVGLASFR
jgi:cysteine-rich repeat protein